MDDNKVIHGRCPWTDDNEVIYGRCPWTMIKVVMSGLIGFHESWGSYWANNHPKISI